MANKNAYCLFKGSPITGYELVSIKANVEELIRLPEAAVGQENWVGVVHFPHLTTGEGIDYSSKDIALIVTGDFYSGFSFIGPFASVGDAIAYAEGFIDGDWNIVKFNN